MADAAPAEESQIVPSIGELVRKAESDYTRGTTQISKHVEFQMYDTLNRIEAYANSKHTTGEQDSLGRDKPFFNIGTAAKNIWYRATDIDRSNIKLRAPNSKAWLDAFLATVYLQDWMRRARFGTFLNEWGHTLAKYGSSIPKFVENDDGLFCSVTPWGVLIVDPVDFDSNPHIEVLELTPAQLFERVQTHGYDLTAVQNLVSAVQARDMLDKQKKDAKSGYIKLYEVNGKLPLSMLSKDAKDNQTFVQQIQVISAVGTRNGRKTDWQDFTLYAGRSAKDPYLLTHLIKEDGRTLAIGAFEYLFESQWMINHAKKAIKDVLDVSSRIAFQTPDQSFVGQNVLTDMEIGQIFTYADGKPLQRINNEAFDIAGLETFAADWKEIGNEIVGVSDAMLGTMPKTGTSWRLQSALLQENYSLFELMTENKGLHIIDMMTDHILPFIQKKLGHKDEISATLSDYDIQRIDSIYIRNASTERTNRRIAQMLIKGQVPTPDHQAGMMQEESANLQGTLSNLGNQRYFVPSEISDRTWQEQFKDLVWEIEVDVTGEANDVKASLDSINMVLKLMTLPGFDQNPKAQALVARALELTGAMSPIEYSSLPKSPPMPAMMPGAPAPAPSIPVPAAGGGQPVPA